MNHTLRVVGISSGKCSPGRQLRFSPALILRFSKYSSTVRKTGQISKQCSRQEIVAIAQVQATIAEQFVGQHLQHILSATPNRELTYWLREGRAVNAEVDYVMALNGKIIPIEIKSGASGSLKSLHQFVGEKGVSVAVRFNSALPSEQRITTRVRKADKTIELDYRLISLPLYLVERLPDIFGSE